MASTFRLRNGNIRELCGLKPKTKSEVVYYMYGYPLVLGNQGPHDAECSTTELHLLVIYYMYGYSSVLGNQGPHEANCSTTELQLLVIYYMYGYPSVLGDQGPHDAECSTTELCCLLFQCCSKLSGCPHTCCPPASSVEC